MNRSVCVTGAGGYIGSALAKTIAAQGGAPPILLDSSERNLFEVQRQIEGAPAVLGSIEDAALLDEVFGRMRPEIVYHTAAFKHVGLLERNPFAAIANNALGSYTLAKAALRHGVSRLLLVSTDKAVHPHSILGVSKRLAELLTVSLSSGACRINAIRLGNVIGSVGSVVPIFLEQLRNGQPLTLTDPNASRYFLSTKEAVTGILAAGEAAWEGKIFVPKLSPPIRILDLAKALGDQAPIQFTGLQPGEKLTEDLTGSGEREIGTAGDMLRVMETRKLAPAECEQIAEQIGGAIARRNLRDLVRVLSEIVPEYVPSSLVEAGP